MNKIWYTHIAIVCFSLIFLFGGCRKSDFILEPGNVVINDNGQGTGTTTWTSDKEYILAGKVFVNDGQVLTIEPGTVIRARQGMGTASSALIVARGGKIIAEGTAVEPIVFTCEGDDLEGSVGLEERGLWGGLAILGSASINTMNGEAHVEGISISEPRGVFGGFNDEDNSGVLRYVSIRHGGTDLGQDNEINGLTLGGVGNKTIIENVEVISNADDGIEIFGGTVNLKNIVVALCSDDAVDIDLGYRGNGQFWCLMQNELYGDKLLEIDGGEDVKTARPYTVPVLYNITGKGRGEDFLNGIISFNDNAGGIIANSVFCRQDHGIELEYSQARQNSYSRWEAGDLQIMNCLFWDVNANSPAGMFSVVPLNDEDVAGQQQALNAYFFDAANRIADPGFVYNETGVSFISENDALTSSYSPLPNNPFFEQANYIGAFGSYNWVGEWTLAYREGLVW
ncbi:MAG: hypothetical protein K9H26_18220 [Prolixibacteraceae bacterium]|nr:hypothetical protein [Prolixibacteraceae bacterium]